MAAPVLHFPPELLLRAQNIRALFLDVDGVLTDGGLYFTARGETLKRFHTLDGHGLKLLMSAGIVPVVVTGRDSPALRARLRALGVEQAHFGVTDKRAAAQAVLDTRGWVWQEVAAMGDDWPDLPVLTRCAFAAAPPHAHAEVRSRVAYVTRSVAGQGAVRELCDLLLVACGRYAEFLEEAER